MSNKNLNVFKMCAYSPWSYLPNWWSNIKQFFRHFKWAWQRAIKGYCDYDCFALDDYYLKLLPATLLSLAENSHGYPDKYGAFENWQTKIREIATMLEEADKIDPIMDSTSKNFEEVEDLQKAKDILLKRGFDLLCEDFWHLWD